MLGRIWRYIRALLLGKLDQLEDPEILLQEAAREMRENLAANRQRAITAITQKNNLKLILDEQQKKSSQMEAQAEAAVKNGNRDIALRFLKEKMAYDETIAQTSTSYEQAVEASDAIKLAIRRQEEVVRQRTAEALAKKAQWKQAQIQIEIDKALNGLTVEDESSTWERAGERIRSAQSEASARAELARESIREKVSELKEITADTDAEKALIELEQKIGTIHLKATNITDAPEELDSTQQNKEANKLPPNTENNNMKQES